MRIPHYFAIGLLSLSFMAGHSYADNSQPGNFFSGNPQQISLEQLLTLANNLRENSDPAERERAMVMYNQIIRSNTPASSPSAKTVASASLAKALVLIEQAKLSDAIATINELNQRFADATDEETRATVASTLNLKGMILQKTGNIAEANSTFDEIITRYGSSSHPAMYPAIIGAFFGKANISTQQRNIPQAIASYDALINRFKDINDPNVQGAVRFAQEARAKLVRP